MDFGAAMFLTSYSMGPGELGLALEERCFELDRWAELMERMNRS